MITTTKVTEKNFLKIYNPEDGLSLNINSVEQAIKSKLPTLNSLQKLNEQKTVALLALYLLELNSAIKIGDRMSKNNINTTAIRIIQKYGFMKLSDIIFVLNKFLDGEIKLYGSLSRRDIMGALHDHSENRSMR